MKLYQLIFSPTGGTKKICNSIAKGFDCEKETISLLPAQGSVSALALTENDVVILGVPAFGGRIPTPVADRLTAVRGRGAKTILVVSFGNGNYADTLLELKELAEARGFNCIVGIVAVAEHSIVREFAVNRPNADDKVELQSWGEAIYKRIVAEEDFAPLDVPGNHPYKVYNGLAFHPTADEKCVFCGRCAAVCPVGAIDRKVPNETDHDICITCMACIHICPQNARTLPTEVLAQAAERLSQFCSGHTPNEIFGLD